MVSSHKALLWYTENDGLEGKRLHDSELFTFIREYLRYLKKADSRFVNPPTLTPTMSIKT